MGERPLVSVVIPTHNRAELLRRALESVAGQDYRPIEIVVVDDCSTDGTRTVIDDAAHWLARDRIGLRSEVFAVNRGPAVARNAGLRLTNGAFVSFLDSDDLWRRTFLSRLVALLLRYPTSAVAFSGHVGIDLDDRVLPGSNGLKEATDAGRNFLPTPFERLITSFPFVTSGTLVRRDALDSVGWFDETLPSWEDADLWLRVAKRFDFAFDMEPLACYRLHAANMTSRRKDWFGNQLRVTLRHLGDVQDPSIRAAAVDQIRNAQVLLQEELLRQGQKSGEYNMLLYNEFAPHSIRFRLGKFIMGKPIWFRRSYARGLRGVGNVRRRFGLDVVTMLVLAASTSDAWP